MKLHRYKIDPQTGCWNWLLYVGPQGYGRVYDPVLKRSNQAHIVQYRKKYGSVPDGLELDHTCRNRRCVNPEHLEPVTGVVNARRGNACKLTAEQVAYIRNEFATGKKKQSELASEFSFHPAAISRIINGKSWTSEIPDAQITIRPKSSTHPGVTFHKKAAKWMAFGSHQRKFVYLGLFDTEGLAAEASRNHAFMKGSNVNTNDAQATEVCATGTAKDQI